MDLTSSVNVLNSCKSQEVYVTKNGHHDGISENAKSVFEQFLGVQGIKSVKIYNRYLVNGLTEEQFESCKKTVFSEAPVDDIISTKSFEQKIKGKTVISLESNPGQYDARVDALGKNISLITGVSSAQSRYTQIVVIDGGISGEDIEKIKKWLINPVEKREVDRKDKAFSESIRHTGRPKIVEGFIEASKIDLKSFLGNHEVFSANKCSLEQADLKVVYDYFKKTEKRDPTETEIRLIETYWSDHCRHTTFLTQIENIDIQGEQTLVDKFQKFHEKVQGKNSKRMKENTLMTLATTSARLLKGKKRFKNDGNLVESEEQNAATYRTTLKLADGTKELWEILFKNETHNSPTETEPFGGAATCIGGAIRDTLSGRAYTFQAMRVSGARNPTEPVSETLAGKLSQRAISIFAAAGYSAYGNQIGLAAGEVAEYFHPGFVAKRFECGYVVGAVKAKDVVKKSPKNGDVVIMFGGRTGRDGIGGATVSSSGQSAGQHEALGSHVQKGNPVEERKIQRLMLDPKFTKLIKKCNDFGAGGVSVAIGELARGLDIDLDVVPLKYDGLNDTEIAISESQERMAIVVAEKDVEKVMQMIQAENIEVTRVATITNQENEEDDRLLMMYQGEKSVDISRAFLDSNGAQRKTNVTVNLKSVDYFSQLDETVKSFIEKGDIHGAILTQLSDIKNALQKGMKSVFDESVGASTILASHGGKYQLSPQVGMVSKIPTFDGLDAKTGIISTHAMNPDLMSQNTYIGGMFAIIESVSKVVALGGNYRKTLVSLQEYFGKLTNDEKWGEVYGAILGSLEALLELNIAAIGGKDSMSGTYKTQEGEIIDVPPTLVSFTNTVVDTDRVVSAELKKSGNTLLYFPVPFESPGVPNIQGYIQLLDTVQSLIKSGKVHSSSVVGGGGMITALSKMMLGNRIGVKIHNKFATNTSSLFTPGLGGIILEISPKTAGGFENNIIGHTQSDETLHIEGTQALELSKIQTAFTDTFEGIFPTEKGEKTVEAIPHHTRIAAFNLLKKVRQPKALVPVFPGTNSELDTKHALIKAGFEVELVVFPTENSSEFKTERERFAKLLEKTHLLVFPGGFSGGDEPDGSAKFIVNTMKSQEIQAVLNTYLARKDSLTLGICNGFQALIKLGVFDQGQIKAELGERDEFLAHNDSLRHETGLVRTRVTSLLSPFLQKSTIGDEYLLPVSHGEGKIIIGDQERLQRYIDNGQVPLQYYDVYGNPSNELNGSERSIAALTSIDGRIFGLMPHPERRGRNIFKNVGGEKFLPLFQSAYKSLTGKDSRDIREFE